MIKKNIYFILFSYILENNFFKNKNINNYEIEIINIKYINLD